MESSVIFALPVIDLVTDNYCRGNNHETFPSSHTFNIYKVNLLTISEEDTMNNTQYFFACLGVGVALAAFKIVYSFFPVFLYIDAGVFLVAGGLAAAIRPQKFWCGSLALALPVFALNLFFLYMNGLDGLIQGIGTGVAWSALIIVASSLAGGWVASRIAGRSQST